VEAEAEVTALNQAPVQVDLGVAEVVAEILLEHYQLANTVNQQELELHLDNLAQVAVVVAVVTMEVIHMVLAVTERQGVFMLDIKGTINETNSKKTF
jgi:hypothetical protein